MLTNSRPGSGISQPPQKQSKDQRKSILEKNVSTKSTGKIPPRPSPSWPTSLYHPYLPTSPISGLYPPHTYRPRLRACLSPHFRHSGSSDFPILCRQACRLPFPVRHWTYMTLAFLFHLTTLPIPAPFTLRSSSLFLFHAWFNPSSVIWGSSGYKVVACLASWSAFSLPQTPL